MRRLRDLAVALDVAVVRGYGWEDINLRHDFYCVAGQERFTVSPAARAELLARLLKLNHERYAEEVKQGLHEPGKKAKGGRNGGAKKPEAGGGGQGSLF